MPVNYLRNKKHHTEKATFNFSLNVRSTWSRSVHGNYESLTTSSSFLFPFFFSTDGVIYSRVTGEKREIYNNKASGITGTSVARRPVVGCNRWRHKPMSTRNLEFLTPSRWLATTWGSRHLIAPTATDALLLSLRPFSYREEEHLVHRFLFPPHQPAFLVDRFRSTHGPSTIMLFYKLPCVAIGARAVLSVARCRKDGHVSW